MSVSTPKSREERLREAIRIKQARGRGPSDGIPRRDAAVTPVLHTLQRGMWLAHVLDPDNPAYNLAGACRVHGHLDRAALAQAYRQLLSRHRLLRSTFVAREAGVEQVIHESVPDAVQRVSAPPGELEAVATTLARRPFDLSQPPLVRLFLVEEPDGAKLLLLLLHHLLADERSLAGLWQELADLMADDAVSSQGAQHDAQYDDWAAWQRTRDQANPTAAAEAFEYWKQQLAVPPDELSLPYRRPATPSARTGRLLVATVHRNEAARLRPWAASMGTTPFAVGAFACKVLLQRLAKDRGFALGVPVSQRHHPDMGAMLGAFINPVMITADIDETARVEDALSAFDRALRENMAHGAVPFSRLAETLAPAGSRASHPLFQAMFVHQEQPLLPRLGEARLEPLLLDLGVAKFDLTLFLAEAEPDAGGEMKVALEFRRDRYRTPDMERLLEAYQRLIGWLTQNPHRPVGDFSLVSDADLAWLDEHAAGPEPAPNGELLPAKIARQAQERADHPAVIAGDERLSYAELQGRVRQVEGALVAAGVCPGDRVGLCLRRGSDLIAGVLGIMNCRASYVPLDPAYPAEHSATVLGDAQVRAVLSDEALLSSLPAGDWRGITLASMKAAQAAAAAAATTGPSKPADTRPQDVAYLLYTSGSTGRPKGVVVTQRNLQASTAARLQVYGDTPVRFLLVPSIAFDSSVAGIFGTLAAGGTLVIPTDDAVKDPRELARLIHSERVSHILCVPSLYAALLDLDPTVAAALSVVIVAGERCPAELVHRHFEAGQDTRLLNEYGPTEGTVWATVHELTPEFDGMDVPIGRPIPGARIDVLDEHGRRLPPGVQGEGWLSGATVAAGYWDRPALSAERFPRSLPGTDTPGPFYRTGDVLSWDDGGVLHFHGRNDDQIKLRGFRIEPGEIEVALAEVLGGLRAVVVARHLDAAVPASNASSTSPEHLVAFIETSDGTDPSAAVSRATVNTDWRTALGRRLPAQALPTRLVRLERFPRLPNGKVDRGALKNLPLEVQERTVDLEAFSATEAVLRELWADLLGREDIDRSDHFFILGGTSLMAVQVALAIERELGVDLPVSEVFAAPTLDALAALIDSRVDSRIDSRDDSRVDSQVDSRVEGDSAGFDHLFPIARSGAGEPLIFAIPHFFTDLVADQFRGERPVWGLRGIGHRPEGNLGRWPTMEDLGAALVAELDRRFPGQPVALAGYSFGASMAFEMASQLQQRGTPVRRLYLIAPMPLDVARVGPLRLQLSGLREPVQSLSSAQALLRWARTNHPFSLNLYRRLWRRTGVEGWRRAQCWRGKRRRRQGRPLTEAMQWADVRVDRFRMQSRYRPGTTSVPTVLFNGIEPETDAAATWRPHFTGPLEVVPLPDPHGDEAAVAGARSVIRETWARTEGSRG